ncbi:auxin-responsive protein SAUR78 [Cucumis sativus]|uniref:auxin-responsive protein SAUR78 n=1 Tax=Cucumis sativus TaxID=3659 RepID=UPI0005ECD920|nr:auxin-responsive protein SAUR78 [Cucumis sativus]KAE8649782.1 hypothetical protein Csa_012026 [Cucumis sativus]
MKKINSLLRKCKSLSRQLGRSSSYSSLRSKSTREDLWVCEKQEEDFEQQIEQKVSGSNVILYVGSTRKKYAINSKYLSHPLLNALIDKSKSKKLVDDDDDDDDGHEDDEECILVRCEVVLFDHLLWMLENSDPNITFDSNLEELAELYVF